MKFSQRQADARHDLVGSRFVNTLHAFIVQALIAWLATNVFDVVRAPTRSPIRDGERRWRFSAGTGSTPVPLTSLCIRTMMP